MTILAVALFGSRARGDENPSSDVDLLMVTDDGAARHASMGNLSLSFYPLPDLHARARSGNLFLCHVLREGRSLYDPEGCFETLKSEFRLRDSYATHIGHAADLAWLIARFGREYPDSPLLRRRIAWCVRSILIGRAAEQGKPVFSPKALAALGPKTLTRRLIAQKDAPTLQANALGDLKAFLLASDLPDPLPNATSPADYARRLEETRNAVGRHFVKFAPSLGLSAGYT